MKVKPTPVTSTVRDRRDAEEMLASMGGVPGAKPFEGRLIYGAKTVKALRSKLGHTQKDFAQLLQVEENTVSSWEQGVRVPDASRMAMLIILEKHPKQFVGFLREAAKVLQAA